MEVAIKHLVSLIKRAIVTAVATALTGCRGAECDAATGSAVASDSAPQSSSINLQIDPHSATFQGKKHSQWEVWPWQRVLTLSRGLLTHPFADCTRPISAEQSGNVSYWPAPDITNETLCRIRSERAHTSDATGCLSQGHCEHRFAVAMCSAHRFRLKVCSSSSQPLPFLSG